jgi:hypothetical protein
MGELATERANFSRIALSMSVISQNATLPVAFSAKEVLVTAKAVRVRANRGTSTKQFERNLLTQRR